MPRVPAAISTYRHCHGMGWVLVRGRCLKAATRICSPRSRCGTRAQAQHLQSKPQPPRNPSCHFIVPLFNCLYSALLPLFVLSPPFWQFSFFFIVPLSPFIVPLFGSSCHFRAEPRDKAVILGAAEFLGHAHRAPPFRRTRHHAAVLHALQSRHYQNRIRYCVG